MKKMLLNYKLRPIEEKKKIKLNEKKTVSCVLLTFLFRTSL